MTNSNNIKNNSLYKVYDNRASFIQDKLERNARDQRLKTLPKAIQYIVLGGVVR